MLNQIHIHTHTSIMKIKVDFHSMLTFKSSFALDLFDCPLITLDISWSVCFLLLLDCFSLLGWISCTNSNVFHLFCINFDLFASLSLTPLCHLPLAHLLPLFYFHLIFAAGLQRHTEQLLNSLSRHLKPVLDFCKISWSSPSSSSLSFFHTLTIVCFLVQPIGQHFCATHTHTHGFDCLLVLWKFDVK